MHAIRELCRLGFQFSLTRETDQGSRGQGTSQPRPKINYRFTGGPDGQLRRPPQEVTAPLFRQIATQKKEAVAYLSGPHFWRKTYVEEENQAEHARLSLERYGFFLLESAVLGDTIAIIRDGNQKPSALTKGRAADIPCYTEGEIRELAAKARNGEITEEKLRLIHETKVNLDGKMVSRERTEGSDAECQNILGKVVQGIG